MINLLIIDDHPLVRDGIQMMLKDVTYLCIAHTAKSAHEALEILQIFKPEIILLDISLPDMNGLELCVKIKADNTYSKVIALTSTNDASIITQMLHRGANGYLLKNMERQDLLDAIDAVLDDKIYLSKAANEEVLKQFTSVTQALNKLPSLTRREKEILALLNEGLNGPQISEKLFLSSYTVETHRKNMMQKFSVNSTQQLLKIAREMRML